MSGCGDDSSDGSGGTGGSAGMTGTGGTGGNGMQEGNFATITVGEMELAFPPDEINGCNNFNDEISGSFAIDEQGNPVSAGGAQGTQINFVVVPSGSGDAQLPSLILDDFVAAIRWQARGIDEANPGVVESWQLDGGRATGTVTFDVSGVGSGGLDETVSGEFDIFCVGI
jgi:hypothetical protein